MKTFQKIQQLRDTILQSIFNIFTSTIGMSRNSFDQQSEMLFIVLISTTFGLTFFGVFVLLVFAEINAETLNRYDTIFYVRIVVLGLYLFILLILTIVHIMFRKTKLWLQAFNFLLAVEIFFQHWYGDGGYILDGSPVDMLGVIIFISVFFGSSFDIVFWTLTSTIMYISAFVWDSNKIVIADYCERNMNNSVWHIISFTYLLPIYNVIIGLFIIKHLKNKLKRSEDIFKHIGLALIDLDLTKPFFIKLITKKEKFCTESEKVGVGIIKSLLSLKRLLPIQEIKRRNIRTRFIGESDSTLSTSTSSITDTTDTTDTSSTGSTDTENNRKRQEKDGKEKGKEGKEKKEVFSRLTFPYREINHELIEKDIILGKCSLKLDYNSPEDIASYYDFVFSMISRYEGSVLPMFDENIVAFFSKKKIEKAVICFNKIQTNTKYQTICSIIELKHSICGYVKTDKQSIYCLLNPKNALISKIQWIEEKENGKTNDQRCLFVDKGVYDEVEFICKGKQVNIIDGNPIFKIYSIDATKEIKEEKELSPQEKFEEEIWNSFNQKYFKKGIKLYEIYQKKNYSNKNIERFIERIK